MKGLRYLAAAICLGLLACTGTTTVTKQMSWECAPEEYTESYSARPEEYARFRYVDAPNCFEVQSAQNLCSLLRNTGKSVVQVEFEVRTPPFSEAGYRMKAINGQLLKPVFGWSYSGIQGNSGACPFSK